MYARNQRGNSLIEVLIAAALVGLMFYGTARLVNRAAKTSSEQQLLNIVLDQMQESLQSGNPCASPPQVVLPTGVTLLATAQGCGTTTPVTVNGVPIPPVPTPVRLSVNSNDLGGQVVVGGTWHEP